MNSSEASFEPLLANPKATWRALDCADARDSLDDFCAIIEIPGAPIEDDEDDDAVQLKPLNRPPAAHHKLLNEKLEAVERGEIRRLMVFMPPGSAKSTYASVVFPVWFMGRKKRRNVIAATYATPLARKIGRRARSIVRQPVYEEVFGAGLSGEVGAANEWALTNENEFMGGGILSGITGNRADLIIVDDPIKGRQEADSETTRAKTRAAFDDDLKTRLKPGGRIVIIQTRWHEEDLAGSILPVDYDGETGWVQGRDGDRWYVLCIPAEATKVDDPLGRRPGEMLWPEWFDETHWSAFRSNPRTWSALYQQSPSPAEGTYFKREWFHRFTERPKHFNVYMTSDHAPGGGSGNDYNVFRVWGLDQNQHIWLLDGFREQCTIDKAMGIEFDEATGETRVASRGGLALIRRWKPLAWFPEDDNNWKSAKPFVVAAMRRTRTYCRIEEISTAGGDKPTKAQPFQAKASMGEVHLPEGPIGDAILDQYLKFPAGKNDDEIDAAANIGRAIDMAHPAIAPVVTKPKPRDLWDEPDASDDDWKTA